MAKEGRPKAGSKSKVLTKPVNEDDGEFISSLVPSDVPKEIEIEPKSLSMANK